MSNPQMLRGETSADFCRRMGWGPGQHLVGDEGYGPTIIRITGMGEETLLARTVLHDGEPNYRGEGPWSLAHRDWQSCPVPARAEKGETE